MEQTLAPGTGLTARQKQLLELAVSEPYITDNFYLTGGTALSSWYLHHRESYDLDFFSQHRFNYDRLIRWFRENEGVINPSAMIFDEDWGFLEVKMRYPNNERLKVDFNHYPPNRLTKGTGWKGLAIDSIYDIAVNKLQTISERPRTRDFVDLYCILQRHPLRFQDLMRDVKKKFSEKVDSLHLAKNFLKVVEYTDLPNMLVPFDRSRMDTFFTNLARSFKKDVFV